MGQYFRSNFLTSERFQQQKLKLTQVWGSIAHSGCNYVIINAYESETF